MSGLREISLEQAMECLRDKVLQKHLYFKHENKKFERVIDWRWVFRYDEESSFLNQTFYMEIDNNNLEEEK